LARALLTFRPMMSRRAVSRLGVVVAVTSALVVAALLPWGGPEPVPVFADPIAAPHLKSADDAEAFRADALRRAQVRRAADPSRAQLDRNPPDPGGLLSTDPVRCRFLPQEANGTTAKFRCVLANGEVIKVKYGPTGEIPAELAATRLLTALGFGADRMYLVPHVRCYGCPTTPFHTVWLLDRFKARDLITRRLPEERFTDFEWAAVERRFDAAEISAGDREGWAWYELDQIDPEAGASRRDVDALRLVAALLNHWDNKASNQRLVCLDENAAGRHRCRTPMIIVQDLGATFGPNKVQLDHWEQTPIWADRGACRLSMQTLPFHGSTFPDVQVTEEGRQLTLRLLRALPGEQTVALFATTRFSEFGVRDRAADPREWAGVLRKKIDEIAAGGPCPATSAR
jgi:hypothetical protein